VLLDDILDLLLLKVLELVLLQVEADLGTTAERRVGGIGGDGESATSSRLPDVLLVVVVLGDDLDALGDEVGRVEADTELTVAELATSVATSHYRQIDAPNHRDVSARRQSLHEALGAGLGDGAEVVDEVGFCHADTSVAEGEDLLLLVGCDADIELWLRLEKSRVGERLVADLVEGIGCVGDDLAKENLFVGVERVCTKRSRRSARVGRVDRQMLRTNDQVQQLRDLSLEAERFGGHCEGVLAAAGQRSSAIAAKSDRG